MEHNNKNEEKKGHLPFPSPPRRRYDQESSYQDILLKLTISQE
jgi:hypothetical protein